jgi:transcriptional regulator with XRE-family HTH domain
MPMVADSPGVGKRLRALRDRAGLTQQQLATAARVSVSVVTQIEQGRTPDPRLSTLRVLAAALGVTVSDLAGDAEKGGGG